MKYFSITSVEEAYHQISATTKEKFWGILGILHSIGETVYPNKYYNVETWRLSQYFENLFRLNNKKKYSGTDEYSFVFSTKWVDVLSQDYLEGRPDIKPILVWAYRNHPFDSELSVAELFETFLNDYHISKESAELLFRISFEDALNFVDSPYSDSDLLLHLGGEKDSEKATLKLGNSFVVANSGDLSRGPYFQPLYAALQTLKCLTIYPFNIHDYYNPEDIDILRVDNSVDDETRQQIFYGAPGTGKSHKIKEKTRGKSVIRTTFHPDSDYSTFVGCYKPTMRVREDNLSIVELTAKLKEMAMSGSTSSYPCQKFSARYWKSLKKLSPKEREDIIVACGFGKSFVAEVNKGMAIGEELAEYIGDDRIVYGFVKQAFLKAYLLAWKKYSEGKVSTAVSPVSISMPSTTSKTPYISEGFGKEADEFKYTKIREIPDVYLDLLKIVDAFLFPFCGIRCFGDLHKKIEVIATSAPSEEQLKSSKYEKRLKGLCEKGVDGVKVYLFLDNINPNIVNELVSTYVHEMFHAYYCTSGIPEEIEEPIVECSMLCFLELIKDAAGLDPESKENFEIIFETAKRGVNGKKDGESPHYGFGAFLFENRSLDWIDLYKRNGKNVNVSSSAVKDFCEKISPEYPFDEEQKMMEALFHILTVTTTSSSSQEYKPVYLVIEEINRGNCAQIFGDLFQLLDRGSNGFSEYPIEADTDLQQEIERAFSEEDEYRLTEDINVEGAIKDYVSNYGATLSEDIQHGRILLLPSNLYIWATMNTSDQSLFPIDSAFKRRWDWKYMKIAKGKDKDGNLLDWKIVVKDQDNNIVKINDADSLPWWDFISKINEIIASMTSSADKQLGYFFCKAKGDTIDEETFVSKVIFYLWNDVFKDYGFEDASLFQYNDGKGEPKDLTFPDFYDEEGKHVNTDRLKDFIKNVMIWKKDKEESK